MSDGIARRPRRWPTLMAIGVVSVLSVVIALWALDASWHRDRVARGVSAGGISLDGFSEDEVRFAAAELTRSMAGQPFTLIIDDVSVTTDPVELGAQVDPDVLATRALEARKGGFWLLRPFRWLGNFFTEQQIPLDYRTDAALVESAVDKVTTDVLEPPTEPRLRWGVNEVIYLAGSSGRTISAEELAGALPTILEAGGPFELTVNSFTVSPTTDPQDLFAVEAEVNNALRWPMNIQVLDSIVEVEPAQLTRWINLLQSPEPGWVLDERQALEELEPLFNKLGNPDSQPQLVVVMDKPLIVPATETVRCCERAGLGEALRAGLLRDRTPSETPVSPVKLEPTIVGGQVGFDRMRELGVVERVSTFTTFYPCCRNRVTNIHLFSDLLRGALILPGEELSLNEHVGMRTTEKGFLADGAIIKGVLEPQIGGGVSQVASTFFSAAFFAGLDFEEYQSHSIYFSRYERGREATISWPRPDLRVANFTDYAVLVWTTYTDTSITVSMYSTDYIEVVDAGRSETAIGQCTRVTTERQRTYPDDVVVTDTVFALYRPAEGLDCNGDPSN